MIRALCRPLLVLAALASLGLAAAPTLATPPAGDPAACPAQPVCTVSLRMMTPPPARPVHLAARHAAERAAMLAVTDRG